jgi:hypothetical protein
MKGLPCTCCQCGVQLSSSVEGRQPLELFCDCLVALCTDCGLTQLTHTLSTTEPYIECPVCGCKQSNKKNGYVVGHSNAVNDVMTLGKSCNARFNIGRRPTSKKANQQHLTQQYIKCGFTTMEGKAGVGGKGGMEVSQMSLPQLELFNARCKQHLQNCGYTAENGVPPMLPSTMGVVGGVGGGGEMDVEGVGVAGVGVAGVGVVGAPLGWGPLNKIKLKGNLVLQKVLELLEKQAQRWGQRWGWGQGQGQGQTQGQGQGQAQGQEEWQQEERDQVMDYMQSELNIHCSMCNEDLQPGNTVRGGECSCASNTCQLCTRWFTTSLKDGPKCCLCRQPVPVLDTQKAKVYQDQLVQQLTNQLTNKRTLTRADKYMVCWDLRERTNIPSDFTLDHILNPPFLCIKPTY